jgi:methylated-DNA-protein-cysteine methyltransferase-like protein
MNSPIKLSEKNRDFFAMVYEVVKQIPKGRVTSYGAIAVYLGMGRSSRMVGWAMNGAHFQDEYIPAHRVVNKQGLLTGKHHFGTPERMQQLLEEEGVVVQNDRVVQFDELFWNPSVYLNFD